MALLSTLVMFWRLGFASLHNAEGDWACVVETMYERSDIFVMQIGNTDYYDKPYLNYWLQLLAGYAFGGVNEWALRIPSAMGAVGAVILTYLMADQFFGRAVAVLSALILTSTTGFIYWGRTGQTEMLNLFGILLGIWMFFKYKDSPGVAWFYVMTLLMAVTSWVKGPLCYTVPGFVVFWHSLFYRDWKWFRWKHIIGATILTSALYMVPFLLSYHALGKWDALALVYHENVTRLFEPWDHVKPFYYYFGTIWAIMVPWTLLAPWLVLYLVRDWKRLNPETKRMLLIFAGVFGFFLLSSSRRSYYLIPVLPFTSILFAVWLEQLPSLARPWQVSVKWLWGAIGVVALVPLLLRLAMPTSAMLRVLSKVVALEDDMERVRQAILGPPMVLAVLLGCAVGIAMIVYALRPVTFPSTVVLVSAVYALMLIYFAFVSCEFAKLRGYREFVTDAVVRFPPEKEIAFYQKQPSAMIFYLQKHKRLRPDYRIFEDLETARHELLSSGGLLLAKGKEHLPEDTWDLMSSQDRVIVKVGTDARQHEWAFYEPTPLHGLAGINRVPTAERP